ncbi:26S proteasome regulatory particle non-ATPase subunit, putative [Eimeria brunetti]|uniref:26S proteasome regulatory particle non-ATPase subunit, putative n=1 Tax=Eimeria brunetti TaxID=51314 RepID=U6LVX8_9EIME|nr:26S proteasome regulatory particle non-ATPase subunit, putative [Eimeria brunetti]
MTLTVQQQQQLLQQIRQQLQQGTADVESCSKQLQQLKLLRVAAVAAAPESLTAADIEEAVLARSTFETAAMLCVYKLQQLQQQQQQQQNADEDFYEDLITETAAAFQRQMNMLLPFYCDLAHVLPPSDMQLELQCLQLLHFLSGDCIAELHVAYDRLSEEVQRSPYVLTVMRLEQRLMSGDYEAVMQQQQQQQQQQQEQEQQQDGGGVCLPRSAAVFLSQLMKTMRLRVAATMETAYSSLSVAAVSKLLRLPVSLVSPFCEEQNRRRRQREAQQQLQQPALEFAAAAAAAAGGGGGSSSSSVGDALASTAAPRQLSQHQQQLLQQQQQQQQSVSTLAAGVGSGSFAAAVSLERSAPCGVYWHIEGDRVVFQKQQQQQQQQQQHCSFHATQVATQLIATAAAAAAAVAAADAAAAVIAAPVAVADGAATAGADDTGAAAAAAAATAAAAAAAAARVMINRC